MAYGPDFSLTKELVFVTTSGRRNPLIAIDRRTGQVRENTREICCVRRLYDWMVSGTFYFLSDSGTFHLLDLKNRAFSVLNLDTLFGFSPRRWFDLHYADGRLSATFASGDSLWLVDMMMSDRSQIRVLLPPVPEALLNYGKLDVTFGLNNKYLRLGTSTPPMLYFWIKTGRSLPITTFRVKSGSDENFSGRLANGWFVNHMTEAARTPVLLPTVGLGNRRAILSHARKPALAFPARGTPVIAWPDGGSQPTLRNVQGRRVGDADSPPIR